MTTISELPQPNAMAGMDAYAARKRELFGGLEGTVLEIGAGEGANFGYLRGDVRWLGLEPNARRRRMLARVAAAYGHRGEIIAAPAERVPLRDAAVDAVISTITLCSVADQAATLAEVRRVLRPGGTFVFFEHVAAPAGTTVRLLQRCCAPFSRRFGAGCDPARETWRAIEAAGFADVRLEWYRRHGVVYTPFIAGIARVSDEASLAASPLPQCY